MSKNKKSRVVQRITQQLFASQTYSGPLPRPEDFQRYEMIYPGAAERILKYAENEQGARLKAVDRAQNHDRLKMILSFIVLMACLVIGGFLVYNGKNVEGFLILIGSSALVGGNAVYRRGKSRNDDSDHEQ